MEKILELEKRINNLWKFYEKQDWILKVQYDVLVKLFNNFAKNWIYFSLRKNNHNWDKKNFLFSWAENYFETWFWTFSNKIVPYNQNFTIAINLLFFKNWDFTIWTTLQTLKENVMFFEENILKEINKKIPNFVQTWKNYETLAKKEEWRIAYSIEKTSDFLKIEDYIIKIWEVLKNINGIENINKKEFLKITEKRLSFIEKNISENKKVNNFLQDNKQQFWIYSSWKNAINWEIEKKENFISIGWDELWDLNKYKTREELAEKYIDIYWKKEKNNELANWDFCNNINIWDIIFVKQWNKKILWYWEVIWNYYFDNNEENHKSKINVKWKEIKEVKLDDIEKVEIKQLALKTLTNITNYKDLVKYLKNKFLENNNKNIMQKTILQKESEQLLNIKKQIILYWPPWTGKTFNVKSIIENHSWENYEYLQTDWKIEFITFHQSFSYEEFIEGIKPDLENNDWEIRYKIKNWIFKNICEKAEGNLVKSKNNKNFNFEKIINDFTDYAEANSDFEIKKWTKIKVEKNSNWDFKTFKTFWNVDNQSLTKDIIERDLQDFLNWKIKKPDDIKPSRESKSIRHWNALYYFALYEKIKDFLEKSWKNYFEEKQELKNYYLIIDEINRWNISKIFGELITLLEADKRIWGDNELKTKLPYSKDNFWIPENLYIVATMNTSDKSIVSLDTALRRRFGFVEMLPTYDFEKMLSEEKFKILEKFEWEIWFKLWNLLEKLNDRIEYLLDKDHLIGHSYFLKVKNIQDLKLAIFNEIFPLLEEYFYWEEENIVKVLWSKLFIKKELNKELFEKNNDFWDDELKYEIRKELLKEENDTTFIEVLKNIVDNQKSLEWEKI